jgi:hypothetical protein
MGMRGETMMRIKRGRCWGPALESLEGRDLPSGLAGPSRTDTPFFHILPYIEQDNLYKLCTVAVRGTQGSPGSSQG